MLTNLKITNITCNACVELSMEALKSLAGVTNVDIRQDGSTTIESAEELAWPEIKSALAEVGKTAVLIS